MRFRMTGSRYSSNDLFSITATHHLIPSPPLSIHGADHSKGPGTERCSGAIHNRVFVIVLLISIGAGFLIAASTHGLFQITLPGTLGLVILLSPTIAAAMLAGVTNSWRGLCNLLSPLSTWRLPIRWYLVALFLPAVLNFSSFGIYVLLGGSLLAIPGSVPTDLEPLVTTLLILLLFSVLQCG